ncbi:MAG: AAA family ATPase, partial [Myxococcota bacterium]
MIQVDELLEVEIRNLFSYCSLDRPTVFDFRKAPGETRNLALVMGRNGYGKTSFINCLRLLFLGAEGDEGRRAVMRLSRDPGGTVLGPTAFVFGVAGQWEGIINRRALQLKEPLVASVKVTWREQDGEAWARRVWKIFTTREYIESLEVQLPLEDEPLTGAEAQNALEQRLPARFMRFYIFDGEDMQHIATGLSEGSHGSSPEKHDIVARLLGIDRVKSLRQLLQGEIKSIGHSARVQAHKQKVEEADQAVTEAQQKLEENRRERAALEKERAELGRLLEELGEQLSELDADKDRRNRMKELREALPKGQRELREKGEQVLKELIAFLPLWADPSLVNETFEQVKSSSNSGQLDGAKAAKTELIELLYANLPTELFHPPVKNLKPELVSELKSRLQYRLKAYVPMEHEEAGRLFHSMGGQDRQKVLSFLSPFTSGVADASESVKQPGN